MKRAWRLGALAAVMLALPIAAETQQPTKLARIGWLSPGSAATHGAFLEHFRHGLRELGYVEGRDVVIEPRWAAGKLDRLPDLAAELVASKVNVIVVGSNPATQVVKRATATIPIVMAAASDPLGTGLVASLARPGGNVTGLASLGEDVMPKLLELLHETTPKVLRVALLVNQANPVAPTYVKASQTAARTLGLQLVTARATSPGEIDAAFAVLMQEQPGALAVHNDPLFVNQRQRLAGLAATHRLPAIYPGREFVEAGGLMSYGRNLHESYRRSAVYVDRILKGAKPGDLPVEQPTKFELVINLKTAKALGLTIPQALLVRAAQVIE